MASPPYSPPSSPSYRQRSLYSMRPSPTSPPSPHPAPPGSPSSPGSPMPPTLDAPWSPPAYYPPSPIYSPESPNYSPSSPGGCCCGHWPYSPPPPSPVYRVVRVRSPTSPSNSPDEEFDDWWDDSQATYPSPGSPVYCNTRASRPIHVNCSTDDSPIGPGYYCPEEFNDHASPAPLGSPVAYSPTSPGRCCLEEFNDDVWDDDMTLEDNVQILASPEYCYCCSMTLQGCCCQAGDGASAT